MKKQIATHTWSLSMALDEWQKVADDLGPTDPAWRFRPTPIHKSNARYLGPALRVTTNLTGRSSRAVIQTLCEATELSSLLALPVDTLADAARSEFLRHGKGINSGAKAESAPTPAARKSANNVASSCRRFLLFFRSLPSAEEVVKSASLWPVFSLSSHREINQAKNARVLYTHIRAYHELRSMNPDSATATTMRASVQDRVERAERTRTGRTHNKYLNALVAVCAGGGLPAKIGELVGSLSPVVSARKKAPDNTMPESLVMKVFPDAFFPRPGSADKFDKELGFPGYFNKLIPAPRPQNPNGDMCAFDHLLGFKALKLRLAILRRYLAATADPAAGPETLCARLLPDRIAEYIFARVRAVGQPNVTIKTEYGHLIAIAKYYCGHDVADAVKKIKLGVRFPSFKESARGEIACRKGGIKELMILADALATHAAQASWLDSKTAWDKPGAGYYLARKSAEIDLRIRIETGFRPGVCDFLVLVDSPGDSTDYPVIWRDGDLYRIRVPWRFMKQHSSLFMTKKELAEREVEDSGIITKCYNFVVAHPLAVAAIDEFRERGWRHARSIKAKETRRLLLNSEGVPFYHDDESVNAPGTLINSAALEAADFVRRSTGKLVVCFTRYEPRHIVSSALEAHCPGHGLKRAYLTHTSDHGSDWVYGTQDNSLLQACVAEVLAGMPPRAEQARLREAAKDEQIRALHDKIDLLLQALPPGAVTKKNASGSMRARHGAS